MFAPFIAAVLTLTPIAANTNRVAAGTLHGHTLDVALDATRGEWYPDGPGTTTHGPLDAFAERGKAPHVPGPLVRVEQGTTVRVRLRNTLAQRLWFHGFVDLPSDGDRPFALAPGAERVVSFRAAAAGTYLYWAAPTPAPFKKHRGVDALLSGVIVVDGPGARRDDRILVLNMWAGALDAKGAPSFNGEIDAINGRSFPATEHLRYREGDRVRFRFVNASITDHPLHLHGFPFAVLERGRFSQSGPVADEHGVTELLKGGQTALVEWTADRAGTWMLHCHLAPHTAPHPAKSLAYAGRYLPDEPFEPAVHLAAAPPHTGMEAMHGMHDGAARGVSMVGMMGGMIVPITVTPAAPRSAPVATAPHRRIRLTVEAIAPPVLTPDHEVFPTYRYALSGDGITPAADDAQPLLIVTRGEPVAVTVHDEMPDPTSVHWHGIDVQDSNVDGNGLPDLWHRAAPMASSGRDVEVRFTPPRAGTFMYHAHMDDTWQVTAGLAAPLVVLEPGERFDPETDHVVMISETRATERMFQTVLVNGRATPAPLHVRAGVAQRLRLLNLTMFDTRLTARIDANDAVPLAPWTLLAEDAVPLGSPREIPARSGVRVSVGQTRDVRFTIANAGTYALALDDRERNGGRLATIPLIVDP